MDEIIKDGSVGLLCNLPGTSLYYYNLDGVMYLRVDSMSFDTVLRAGKRLIMMRYNGESLTFMRAADVIDAWPQTDRTVRAAAKAQGLRI